jgi:hypothetical protein
MQNAEWRRTERPREEETAAFGGYKNRKAGKSKRPETERRPTLASAKVKGGKVCLANRGQTVRRGKELDGVLA